MTDRFERPVRLAVFFEQEISIGGGYQQALNAALLVKRLDPSICDPVFVVVHQGNVEALAQYGVTAIWLPLSKIHRLLLQQRSEVLSRKAVSLLARLLGSNRLDRFLSRHQVDLLYFTSPSVLANVTERYNYIYTLWDLCHRDEVDFPEVYAGREFERREEMLWHCVRRASAVMVDAELTRENVARRCGADPDRVHVLPFSPAQSVLGWQPKSTGRVDVKAKYGLTKDYVYYPAQYWPHKNHVYLLRGLKRLEEKHDIALAALFSGSDQGNRAYVEKVAAELGLSARIRFAGLVPNDEIPPLYLESVALVMPSYFGPTNLPPLEAFSLEVPVLYSDLPGLREQVGDAALLMDLSNPDSLADQLHTLLTVPGLRDQLVEKGTQRLSCFSDAERLGVLANVLVRYRQRLICGPREH